MPLEEDELEAGGDRSTGSALTDQGPILQHANRTGRVLGTATTSASNGKRHGSTQGVRSSRRQGQREDRKGCSVSPRLQHRSEDRT